MGTLGNLFEILRDTSYGDIEKEAAREVAIVLAGNSAEVRDKLHRALSTRLESLWTPSPFRLIETNERPTVAKAEGEEGGLLIYALYQGDRMSSEKRRWLRELALSGEVGVILTVLDRQSDKPLGSSRRVTDRIQALNPLRLVGGREGPQPAADGASFNNADAQTSPAWQSELEELRQDANGKISVIHLGGLELSNLQVELLPLIVTRLEGRELALARRAPVFRNAVASHLIADTARSNAQLVLLANLTAGLPFLSGFFASGADFVVLTKNQFELSHRLAGVYGQKRDSRVEIYLELAPIIGAAFAWKTLSAMAARRFPPLLALLPKAGISYAATMVVGRLAQVYYASGRKAPAQAAAFVRRLLQQLRGGRGNNGGSDAPGDSPRQLRSS